MMSDLILEEIDNNRELYIDFLITLIKADSYNPPGNENNVAEQIEKFLKKFNVKSEKKIFGKNRANLFAYLHEDFKGKNLLFNGHMDVVSPPIETVKKEGKLYGRGATDMKGNLAAMVIALTLLQKFNKGISGNVILNAVADEETGKSLGTKWCLDHFLRPKEIKCDFAIVGEFTGFGNLGKGILVGEKGSLKVKIITHGKTAHSSVPHTGINAVDEMLKIFNELPKFVKTLPINPKFKKITKRLSKHIGKKRDSKELYNTICNIIYTILKIESPGTEETSKNVLPDKCESTIDFRFPSGYDEEGVFNALNEYLRKKGFSFDPNSEGYIELENEGGFGASLWNDWEGSEHITKLSEIVTSIYHKKPFIGLFPAGTDAEYYREKDSKNSLKYCEKYCEKVILLGAGDYTLAHSPEEYVELEDFINIIKVYTLFAYHFLTSN